MSNQVNYSDSTHKKATILNLELKLVEYCGFDQNLYCLLTVIGDHLIDWVSVIITSQHLTCLSR